MCAENEITINMRLISNFLKINHVHVTTAAKLLGHSDLGMTLKIYTLVRDDEIHEIGKKLRAPLKIRFNACE